MVGWWDTSQLMMSINSMRSRNLGLLQSIIQEWIDEYYRMRDNQVCTLFILIANHWAMTDMCVLYSSWLSTRLILHPGVKSGRSFAPRKHAVLNQSSLRRIKRRNCSMMSWLFVHKKNGISVKAFLIVVDIFSMVLLVLAKLPSFSLSLPRWTWTLHLSASAPTWTTRRSPTCLFTSLRTPLLSWRMSTTVPLTTVKTTIQAAVLVNAFLLLACSMQWMVFILLKDAVSSKYIRKKSMTWY